ncbi:MAG: hypothetical protein Q4D38_10305 [Planctomycetia bacterium]|nr:hypothetical protein [Planctomycetia bacterium]
MTKETRVQIYFILIFLSLGLILGRIFAVDTINKRELQNYRLKQIPKQLAEKTERLRQRGEKEADIEREIAKTEKNLRRDALLCFPFFSANDRSRWCTIRALVEPEMRVEGAPYAIDKVRMEKGWDTIDMVKHDDHYYSSKPPLLPTMIAGIYWLVYHFLGISFASDVYLAVKIMLALVNLPMMFLFLFSVVQLAERLGRSDWTRIFIVATACFATFLSTFCVTLNNHLPGVMCVSVSLWLAVEMIFEERFHFMKVFLIGAFASFGVVNELPALSYWGAIFVALAFFFPWRSATRDALALVGAFCLGTLCVAAPFFATNYVAHQSLRPPYMHRQPGDNWYEYTYIAQNGREVESYWQNPQGIDKGEASRAKYAFHVLLGHHGVFSLTPVWIFSAIGIGLWLHDFDRKKRLFALLILGLSVLILGFYIARPLNDRNYGGIACGFRWAFWLIPLWLCAMLPTIEWLEKRRWGRGLALVFLALSALSVAYPIWNPWTHPWLFGE